MLKFSVQPWIAIGESFRDLSNPLSAITVSGLTENKEEILEPLERIAEACRTIELEFSLAYAIELIEHYSNQPTLAESVAADLKGSASESSMKEMISNAYVLTPKHPSEVLALQVETLKKRIEDELRGRVFLTVKPSQARLYIVDRPFGDQVVDSFRSAANDVEEAAKCLSLDRPTASVFHLMRVMESGLKAVAKDLGVAWTSNWGTCLNEIEKQAATKKDPFFAEAVAYLRAVKKAWRNPTMHIERIYSEQEAERIFQAVEAFMVHLATRLTE